MKKSGSEYDSFLFWRQPIPALELSELEDLGLPGSGLPGAKQTKSNMSAQKKKKNAAKLAKTRKQQQQQEVEEAALSEYNSFNYWRDPIVSVSALDLNLLL